MTPKWPVLEPEASQSFLSMLKESWYILSLSREELNNLQWSGVFHETLTDNLTKSFDLLNQAKQISPVWKALDFQDRFEQNKVNINKKFRTPIHPSPERLTAECEKIFTYSFVPTTKPSSDKR